MNPCISMLLALVCLGPCSLQGGDRPGPDAVVVKVLDQPLPHDEDGRRAFLWDTFANKPEAEQFDSYTDTNWKTNYAVFSRQLAQKARSRGLDSDSLQKALDKVLAHSAEAALVYLPVGAYLTTLDGLPVWIVIVKWECPGEMAKGGLSHIRMFAFDQKTLNQVGFCTCM